MNDCFVCELHFTCFTLKCLSGTESYLIPLQTPLYSMTHLTNSYFDHIQDLDCHITIGWLDVTICGMRESIFQHQASSCHVWLELVLKSGTFA